MTHDRTTIARALHTVATPRLWGALSLLLLGGCSVLVDGELDGKGGAGGTTSQTTGGTGGMGGSVGGGGAATGGATAGGGGTGGIVSGGGGVGGSMDCGALCPPEECCNGACVDLTLDPLHCGACGDACTAAAPSCCTGVCAATQSDTNNCGTCGTQCPGTTCNGGCTSICAFPFENCDQNLAVNGCEADLVSDPTNCGGCGILCPVGAECMTGSCVCPVGFADCDGDPATGCEVDLDNDPLHCTACGASCGAQQDCVSGTCTCDPGFEDCNMDPLDGCEAAIGSALHCTACFDACEANMLCNAGCECAPGFLDCSMAAPGCEASASDPLTCGDCNTQCLGGEVCDGVICDIDCGALTECSGACADTDTSPLHCGGCDQPVGPNETCIGGVPTCDPGFDDCTIAVGCETDLLSDPLNCNACMAACNPGAICNIGACECGAGLNDCGADCRVCCDDTECGDGDGCTTDTCAADGSSCANDPCGGGDVCCGGATCQECCTDADCNGNDSCSGGICLAPCPGMTVPCDGQCVNLDNDEANCGSCGNECGTGRTCMAMVCTPDWILLTTTGALAPREMAAVTWTGSAMFVWSGRDGTTAFDDGALYDPTADAWTTISQVGQPPDRVLPATVWTGTRVLVWGGGNAVGNGKPTTGGLYDPSLDTWITMSEIGAPSGRSNPIAVWTGSRMLVWGGVAASGNGPAGGAMYVPSTDTWETISITGAPSPRTGSAATWTGTELLLFGGELSNGDLTDEGYGYEPSTDTWRSLNSSSTPAERRDAFATWTGSRMLIVGGTKDNGDAIKSAARYDPVTDTWSNMKDHPKTRYAPRRHSGWTAFTGALAVHASGVDNMGNPKREVELYQTAHSLERSAQRQRRSGWREVQAVRGLHLAAAATIGLATLVGGTNHAYGQSSADVAAARDLFNEAAQLVAEERWDEARDRYERSFALKHEPITLYSLGVAQKESGHLVDALESFRAFLKSSRSAAAEAYVPAAETAVSELEGRVARLTITVRPADAEGLTVVLDGDSIPIAALGRPRLVDPGPHAVVARAEGYRQAVGNAELSEAGSDSLTLELKPLPKSAAPEPEAPEPGRASPPPPDEGDDGGSVVLPVTLLVGGIALLGGGVAVGMAGLGKASAAPASEGDDADSARTLALVGDVMGGIGIAAASVGLILLIVHVSGDDGGASTASLAATSRDWAFGPSGVGPRF